MSLVVKIGGGLASIAGALDAVCDAVRAAGRSQPLLVIPGGGPFADAVREFDRHHGLSAASAHSMAILAMEQYAHVLAERIGNVVRVEEPAEARAALRAPGIAVLFPSRWLRTAPLPYRWEVTSDSIAAFVAGVLEVERLVLVKPVNGGRELLDPYFDTVCPPDLTVTIVGYNQLDRLEQFQSSLA